MGIFATFLDEMLDLKFVFQVIQHITMIVNAVFQNLCNVMTMISTQEPPRTIDIFVQTESTLSFANCITLLLSDIFDLLGVAVILGKDWITSEINQIGENDTKHRARG